MSKKHFWLEAIWGHHLLADLGESYLVSVELGQCTLGIKGNKDLVLREHLHKRIRRLPWAHCSAKHRESEQSCSCRVQ